MSRFLLLTLCLAFASLFARAAEFTAIECVEPDPSFAEQYETVRPIADFEEGFEGWRTPRGGQAADAVLSLSDEAVAGAKSMRVDYAFCGRESLEYIDLATDVPMDKPGLFVGFAFRRGDAPLQMCIRVMDASGETHQCAPQIEKHGDWEYAVADQGQSHASHWGGDGNGRLDYPCRLVSIVADRPRIGYQGRGSLLIDDVRLVRMRPRNSEDRPQVRVAPYRFGCVYAPGEEIALEAAGDGEEITWESADFFGRVTAEGKGPAAKTAVSLPTNRQGYFGCTFTLLRGGKPVGKSEFRYAVLPEPLGMANEYVGFCCHFRGGAYPLECMDLLVRYGFREFRDEISWQNVEPEPGRYVMPEYGERLTAKAKAAGLNPLLILDYGNSHYNGGGFPNDEATVAAYARYCAELAKMLAGRVRYFEIWNEWSIGCGMQGKPGSNKPEYYGRMLIAAGEALKGANPEATVVGIGGEHDTEHFENIRVMFETAGGKSMDAFSVHSYRYPSGPEEGRLHESILKVGELAGSLGIPRRIWVTEIGWPTHLAERGVDERTQAGYLVRTLALLQGTGLVEKVYWYDFKDDGLNRRYNEDNFGVIRHERFGCAPKPGVVAASVFTRFTAGAKVVSFQANGVHRLNYEKLNGEKITIAWLPEGGEPVRAAIEEGQTAYNLMGEVLHGERTVEVGPVPVYLVAPETLRGGLRESY